LKIENPLFGLLSNNNSDTYNLLVQSFLFVVKHGTPKDDELEELGDEIVEKWKKLGRRLDVSDAKLHEINQAHDQLSEKGYHMLKHWKQEKGPAATYQALCDALKHKFVQRQDLAVQFCYINGNYALQIVLNGSEMVSVIDSISSVSGLEP